MSAAETRRGLIMAIGAAMFATGAFLLFIGIGAKIEDAMRPPPVWDLEAPPASLPYRVTSVQNAVCRLDDRARVEGRDTCLVPLVKRGYAKPESGHDYAQVPLIYYAPCDLLNKNNAQDCKPRGNFWEVSTLATIEAGIKKRFPGFKGQIVEFPDPDRLAKKQKEDLILYIAFFAIGIVLVGGGLRAFLRAKRSTA